MTPPPSKGDRDALRKLYDLAEGWSLEELIRFCQGTMNALVVVQQVFKNRFPAEFAAWEEGEFFNDPTLLQSLSGDD